MAYQRLPKYQISFPLFKVSEPWIFQMSSFCVSTDETHSSKQAIFFSFQTEWQNESYLTQWHTKGFQNIKLVSLYSKSVNRENSKCLHFASVLMKHIVQNRPFFSHSKQIEKNESYLTQWHIKGFQNIKLVSLYSESVSCENSRCLHFASEQLKHIIQNRPFFSHPKQNDKMSNIWHNGIPETSKISN